MTEATRPAGHGGATLAAAAATIAASLSLAPLFTEQTWFWPTALTVVAVAGTGYALRRLGQSAVAVHAAQLLALLLALVLFFARDDALFGLVPTPTSLTSLADLLGEGLAAIATTAPPVGANPPLTLIAAGGVALVFLLVDLLAVTLRSPVAAAAPLLGLLAVAVILTEASVGWPVFALTAAAWLTMIRTDSGRRLSEWGVAVGHADAATAPAGGNRSLASAGRGIGALAVAAAVAVPALLPTAGGGIGWFGDGGGGGIGGNTVETVNPYVDIQDSLTRGEDSEVLTYRTSDGDGALLRLATLDQYLADIWQQGPLQWPERQQAADGIPIDAGSATTATPFTIDVEIGPLDENRLPLPYPTTRVAAEGDWRFELSTQNVLSPELRTPGLSYQAESLRLEVDAGAIPTDTAAPELQQYVSIPKTTSRIVTQTAIDVTAAAETPFEAAVALQEWFRSDFDYDVSYRPGDGDPMVAFLNDRRGYCQQFASTMALMARSLGIPARVNVGFAPGSRNADGSWTVTWHDTHAWPELYFPGLGWTAFEPTPRGGAGFAAPPYTVTADAPVVPTPTPSSSAAAGGHERLDPETGLTDPDAIDAATTPTPDGGLSRWWLLLVAAGALLVPAGWRLIRRRRRARDRSDAEAAWAEWRDSWIDLGGEWVPGWTPRQAAAVTGDGLDPEATVLLQRLSDAVEWSRYAPVGAAAAASPGAPDPGVAVARLRRALLADAGRPRRWAARLAPRSTWRSLLRGAEQGAAALDRTEQNLVELTRVGRN